MPAIRPTVRRIATDVRRRLRERASGRAIVTRLRAQFDTFRRTPVTWRRALGYGGYAVAGSLLLVVLWQIGLVLTGHDRPPAGGFDAVAVISLPPYPPEELAETPDATPPSTVLAMAPEPRPPQPIDDPQSESVTVLRLPNAPQEFAANADPSGLAETNRQEPPTDATIATDAMTKIRAGSAPEEATPPIPSAAALETYARTGGLAEPLAVAPQDDAPTLSPGSSPETVPIAPRPVMGPAGRDESDEPTQPAIATVAALTIPSRIAPDSSPTSGLPETDFGGSTAPSWPDTEPEQVVAAQISVPPVVESDAAPAPMAPETALEIGPPAPPSAVRGEITIARLDDPTQILSDALPARIPGETGVDAATRALPSVEPGELSVARSGDPGVVTTDTQPATLAAEAAVDTTTLSLSPDAPPETTIARLGNPTQFMSDTVSARIPSETSVDAPSHAPPSVEPGDISVARSDDPGSITTDAQPATLAVETAVDTAALSLSPSAPPETTIARLGDPGSITTDAQPVTLPAEAAVDVAALSLSPNAPPESTMARLGDPSQVFSDAVPARIPAATSVDTPSHEPPNVETENTTVARLGEPGAVTSDAQPATLPAEAAVETTVLSLSPDTAPETTIARLANPAAVVTDATPAVLPFATELYAPANIVPLDELAQTAVSGFDNPSNVRSDAEPPPLPAETYIDGFSHIVPPREPPQAAPASPVFAPRTLAPGDAPSPPNSADLVGAELNMPGEEPNGETLPRIDNPAVETGSVSMTPMPAETVMGTYVRGDPPVEPNHVTLARLEAPTVVASDVATALLAADAEPDEYARVTPAPEPALAPPPRFDLLTTDTAKADDDFDTANDATTADSEPTEVLDETAVAEATAASNAADITSLADDTVADEPDTTERTTEIEAVFGQDPVVGDAQATLADTSEALATTDKLAPAAVAETRGVGDIEDIVPVALPENELDPLPDALGPGKLAATPSENTEPALPTIVEAALNTPPSEPPPSNVDPDQEPAAAPTPQNATQESDDEPVSNWVDPEEAAAPAAAAPSVEIAAVDGDVTVNRMIMTRGVENREPIDRTARFRAADGQVVAFASFGNTGPPTKVTFSWYRDDALASSTELKVGTAASWRTWSRSGVSRGAWRVEITDQNGVLLSQSSFTVE